MSFMQKITVLDQVTMQQFKKDMEKWDLVASFRVGRG
jgi:hypothetical protein